jgi:hypothetical protein
MIKRKKPKRQTKILNTLNRKLKTEYNRDELHYFLDKLICPPEESESYEQFEDNQG